MDKKIQNKLLPTVSLQLDKLSQRFINPYFTDDLQMKPNLCKIHVVQGWNFCS
jgi:hypothetical protein